MRIIKCNDFSNVYKKNALTSILKSGFFVFPFMLLIFLYNIKCIENHPNYTSTFLLESKVNKILVLCWGKQFMSNKK